MSTIKTNRKILSEREKKKKEVNEWNKGLDCVPPYLFFLHELRFSVLCPLFPFPGKQ